MTIAYASVRISVNVNSGNGLGYMPNKTKKGKYRICTFRDKNAAKSFRSETNGQLLEISHKGKKVFAVLLIPPDVFDEHYKWRP